MSNFFSILISLATPWICSRQVTETFVCSSSWSRSAYIAIRLFGAGPETFYRGLLAESGNDHGSGHQMPCGRSGVRCTLIASNPASVKC